MMLEIRPLPQWLRAPLVLDDRAYAGSNPGVALKLRVCVRVKRAFCIFCERKGDLKGYLKGNLLGHLLNTAKCSFKGYLSGHFLRKG
jgi:hypothetical protein